MRKLFYISLLVVVAGCSQPLVPQQPPPPPSADLAAYFWPDSTKTYTYTSTSPFGNDIHTISVQTNGIIIDNDSKSGVNTTLTVTKTSNSYVLSGFSPSDFLALDPTLSVVHDTNAPQPRIETIRSIAASNTSKFGAGKLYALSDSILYQIDLHSNALVRLNTLPASGLTLAEDGNSSGVFAFQKGGNGIYWTSNGGSSWTTYSLPAGNAITAFASVNRLEDHSSGVFWVAAGSLLYLYSNDSTGLQGPLSCPIPNITALESSQDGAIIAGDNGAIYDVSRDGEMQLRGVVHTAIRGLAGNYFSTSVGVFDFTKTSPAIVSGDDSAIYSTFFSTYIADSNGSVDHLSGTNNTVLAAPRPGYAVTQFAYPNQAPGVYALAGGQVYYYQQGWSNVNQTLSAAPSFTPGTFTLLSSDTAWTAGYVESSKAGIARGYIYQAVSSGAQPYALLDGNKYYNVILVNLAAWANGTFVPNLPQYNIYFQKGKGPIRIERTENGVTTTLVRSN